MNPAARSPFACACPGTDTGVAWWRILTGAFLAVNTMTFTLAVNASEVTAGERQLLHWATLLATVAITALLGGPLWTATIESLRRRQVTVEILFALSYLGALAASLVSMLRGDGAVFFETAGIALVVYAAGRAVGRYSQRRVLQSLAAWNPRQTLCHRVEPNGTLTEVTASNVQIGDVLRVHPGEIVPVDGIITTGSALLRESDITGEPLATAKIPGDMIHAGSAVLDATVELRATSSGTERLVDRITAVIDDINRRPAPTQLFADRTMRWFVPFLLLVCAITAAYWYQRAGFAIALFHSMAVLLVACPCALGFATPITVWTGIGRLQALGLVARSGEVVEKLAAIDTVVFDKTGTLTLGASQQATLTLLPGTPMPEAAVRSLIAAAERHSSHPLAAVLAQLGGDDLRYEAERLTILPGIGLAAQVRHGDARHEVQIGMAARLHPELCNGTDPAHRIAVLVDGQPAALVRLTEQLVDGCDQALRELQSTGIRLLLMTGDAAVRTARIPIAEVHSGLTPDDKLRLCEGLTAAGRRTLFVGDGLNDAAAMSACSTSVAVEDGSDVTREAAEAVWTSHDLAALPRAVTICRETVQLLRRQVWVALGYNLVGIALAAVGMLHPVAATLLMTVSSCVVTWRSISLLEVKEP